MRVEVGFGQGTQVVEIPDRNLASIMHANEVEVAASEQEIVAKALAEPIGLPHLGEYDLAGKRIAIVTSDITRPMPTYKVMPQLLDILYEAGAEKENITVVFGLGVHRKHTDEEKKKLIGERAYSEIACEDSTDRGFVNLGCTSRGTPIDIAETVANADFRICLGNIEFHYFAGYSGGAKAIMPGVSTPAAIQENHQRMVQDVACAGRIKGNPIREDIEEAAAICGIDYLLNVVLDEHKNIVCAVAGDATEAHRAGCEYLDALYRVQIPQRYDIVVVSQGGAPKDLNLYQTQKALDNAKYAVKDGGVIILVGSCKEGLGNKTFEEWLVGAKNPAELIERIQKDFRLGGHKAAAIALVQSRADVYLVSEMEPEFVRSLGFEPYAKLQPAFDAAMEKMGKDAAVLVMPFGGSTLPIVKEG